MSNSIKIFDSHCHPQFPQYDEDREEMLGRAIESGVGMICVGTDIETSRRGIKLAQKHENMWASVGIHPNDTESIMGQVLSIEEYENLLKEEKVVAIGEIGLDYYRTPEKDKQENQKKVFADFLGLAIKYNKPVIIHSRDAAKGSTGRVHDEILRIIGNWKLEIGNFAPWRGGVAHSFTGSVDDAKKYLDLGFYLGFNGILTFTHQYDEVIRYVPIENILLETDAPFLAPEPYRGKRNEPAYVTGVAKKIAELKNLEAEQVTTITTENCLKLFNLI